MPKLILANCQILARENVQSKTGVITNPSRVMFLGGQMSADNPDNLVGLFASVELEIEIGQDARGWSAKDGRTGTMISCSIRPTRINSAKK